MARIPYQDREDGEMSSIVAAIRARRGGKLYNLDRMLLHSPAFAAGWNAFLGPVRTELSLSPLLRELAICVVAVVNNAEYEFIHHLPEYIAAGANSAKTRALKQLSDAQADTSSFSEEEQAVIALTIELTQTANVSDETLIRAKQTLGNDQRLVELIGVVAAYNMVSRFLNALGVEPESHIE